jgi:tRNA(Ile2) C34 agmatinyltransferase TiaS
MSAVATRRRGKQLALVTERPRREAFDLERLRRDRSICSDGGRLTLEQRLEGVWEGLHAAGVADCPLCGGRMEDTGEDTGRCGGCGTAIS